MQSDSGLRAKETTIGKRLDDAFKVVGVAARCLHDIADRAQRLETYRTLLARVFIGSLPDFRPKLKPVARRQG
jgi:hypothetical protein